MWTYCHTATFFPCLLTRSACMLTPILIVINSPCLGNITKECTILQHPNEVITATTIKSNYVTEDRAISHRYLARLIKLQARPYTKITTSTMYLNQNNIVSYNITHVQPSISNIKRGQLILVNRWTIKVSLLQANSIPKIYTYNPLWHFLLKEENLLIMLS